jgi:hypothetical protein
VIRGNLELKLYTDSAHLAIVNEFAILALPEADRQMDAFIMAAGRTTNTAPGKGWRAWLTGNLPRLLRSCTAAVLTLRLKAFLGVSSMKRKYRRHPKVSIVQARHTRAIFIGGHYS